MERPERRQEEAYVESVGWSVDKSHVERWAWNQPDIGNQMKDDKATGRAPKGFAAFLTELRNDEAVQDAIRAAATDPTSKGFAPVLRALTDYDNDKPAEKRQVVGPVEVKVRIVREGRRITAS